MKRTPSKDGNLCFVAMWFDDSINYIYDNAIYPILKEVGYEPLRIDKKEHVNKIDDEIVAGIRNSKLMIADFTGHRGGVYYEAGFAQGLKIPVIWTCQKSKLKKVHFDIRQYKFIDWENEDDLKKRLKNLINARYPLTLQRN